MTGLGEAYRGTSYVVALGSGDMVVHIGDMADVPAPGFGAIVTAWNPGSRHCSAEENQVAAAELAAWIDAQGLAAYPSRTVTQDPAWVEEGWLILGLAEDEAVDLAWRFGQNALIWIARGEPARLVATSLWRETD